MKKKKFLIGNRVYVNLYGVDATVVGYHPDRFVVKTDFPVAVGQLYLNTFTCCGWELSAPCSKENQKQ